VVDSLFSRFSSQKHPLPPRWFKKNTHSLRKYSSLSPSDQACESHGFSFLKNLAHTCLWQQIHQQSNKKLEKKNQRREVHCGTEEKQGSVRFVESVAFSF
jgi:hypothetical protein